MTNNRSYASENRTKLLDGDSFTKSMGTGGMGSATSSFGKASMNRSQHSQQPIHGTVFSNFGEAECGEGILPQHIVLDFTPTEEDEIEEMRLKCMDFWEMFQHNPEMQKMVVEPDPDLKDEFASEKESSYTKQAPSSLTIVKGPVEKVKTAMSLLDELEERDLLHGVLSTKMADSVCSLGSRQYHEHDPVSRGVQDIKVRQPCRCIGTCNQKCGKKKKMIPPEVQLISKTLNDWTTRNPKSMEPPGRPPGSEPAVTKRKI